MYSYIRDTILVNSISQNFLPIFYKEVYVCMYIYIYVCIYLSNHNRKTWYSGREEPKRNMPESKQDRCRKTKQNKALCSMLFMYVCATFVYYFDIAVTVFPN